MKIINAEGGTYGRICSYAAKKALEGEKVVIVNAEKAVITGKKTNTIEKYKRLRQKGAHSLKGPKYPKESYKILKRGIRGMLPDHRKGIGKKAFSNIKVYEKIPEKFKDEKMITLKKPKTEKYITLKEVSEKI